MPLQSKAVAEFEERCFGNKPLLQDADREPLAAGRAVIELLNIGGSWGYVPGIAKCFWWARDWGIEVQEDNLADLARGARRAVNNAVSSDLVERSENDSASVKQTAQEMCEHNLRVAPENTYEAPGLGYARED